jgi:hypothetical protein
MDETYRLLRQLTLLSNDVLEISYGLRSPETRETVARQLAQAFRDYCEGDHKHAAELGEPAQKAVEKAEYLLAALPDAARSEIRAHFSAGHTPNPFIGAPRQFTIWRVDPSAVTDLDAAYREWAARSKAHRDALRKTLLQCIAHFQSLEVLVQVLRVGWEFPDPSCLNIAEINRLAAALNRGPVFRVERVDDGTELWVNHPATDSPAMFSVRNPGMIPVSYSQYSRQLAETNLVAWIELVSASAPNEGRKPLGQWVESWTPEKKAQWQDSVKRSIERTKGIPESINAAIEKANLIHHPPPVQIYEPHSDATPPRTRTGPQQRTRDKKTEARDKWIYDQCCERMPYDNVVAELKRIGPKRGWRVVSSKQRIQQIGNEYPERHGLDRPPPRQSI